jgi:FkbM family methyltransferase
MALSLEERLKHLLPGWLYYTHKIADQARKLEPELRILQEIVPAGRTAIDVGANRGYYSYALSKIASRVEAFEPHPELARFARRKLGRNVRLHEVALSNQAGSAVFYIPQERKGIDAHYNASLKKIYQFPHFVELRVQVSTLDAFAFADVGFIKVDVEGADMEVIEGARQTIARDRPNMLIELMVRAHADPLACIEQITREFGYDARIMVDGRLADARAALRNPPPAWETYNVVFTPK